MSDEDTKPLLSEEENQTARCSRSRRMSPTSQVRHLLKLQRKPRYITNGNGYDNDVLSGDQINISTSNSANDLGEDPPDDIVSVFIVAFDTKSGNMVEWYLPDDCDMQGVEFKAMPSGAHTVNSDFLYFKKGNLYGVSCYEKMKLDSEEERGARMKSVGILATSYTMLHKHLPFLEKQVRHQLQTPGNYQQLAAFYEDKKGLLPLSSLNGNESGLTTAIISNPSTEENDFLDMTVPDLC